MNRYPPHCTFCDAPMRVLTGTGRNPFYCANDCDRVKRPPCPQCKSPSTREFNMPWSNQIAWACNPCGAVFGNRRADT